MPLRDSVVAALRVAFPDRPFVEGVPPDPIATFPEAHPAVGPASVWDDGSEATVGIGEITHVHFEGDNYLNTAGTSPDLGERVAAEVVAYLADVFAERVILWREPTSPGTGGTYYPARPFSLMSARSETFHWSGPTQNPLRTGS